MNTLVIVILALVAAAQANAVYKRLQVEDRIVGGDEAKPHSYPYQAYVQMYDEDGNSHQCGGSLLTPTIILTAAHCVELYGGWNVYLGAHDISKNEPTQQRFRVSTYITHEGYNPVTLANDIAVLILDYPAEINEYVQLTTLPTRADVGDTFFGRFVIVSGWGRTSDDSEGTSNVLKHVSSGVTLNQDCQRHHSNLTPQQICVNGMWMDGACNGDDGGPLVLAGSNKVQIGIVSYGSSEGCAKGYDVVYTRITEYLDWIEEIRGVKIN